MSEGSVEARGLPGRLTRQDVLSGLEDLATLLEEAGRRERLYLVGGAVMTVVLRSRDDTLDVDTSAMSSDLKPLVEEVARRHGWADAWLSAAAGAYVPPGGEPMPSVVMERPGLSVTAASPEVMLAMKLRRAWTRTDAQDISFLISYLGLRSPEEALEVCDSLFPGEGASDAGIELLEGMSWGDQTSKDERAPLPRKRQPPPWTEESDRCGAWVDSAGGWCILRAGHGGNCRTR